MFKDIRHTPAVQTLQKSVGAKYLVKTFGPRSKQDAAESSALSLSSLKDALTESGPQSDSDTRRSQTSAAVAQPQQRHDNTPLRDGLSHPGRARCFSPPPMPDSLTASSAQEKTAERHRVVQDQAGFSPLRDGHVTNPTPAQDKAAAVLTTSIRLNAQKGSPADLDVAIESPPVFEATHENGVVLGSDKQVRLRHARQAAAQGGFGRFYRAITPEGQLRGLKETNTSGASEAGSQGLKARSPDALFAEVGNMKRLGMNVYAIYETPQKTMLVETDLFAGDLVQAFRHIPRYMRANAARSALAQQARQLAALHAAGFMHRDVKSENTLFSENGVVQVADPGLATQVKPGVLHGPAGTINFMAPEVLATYWTGGAHYGPKADTWSLGVVACESLVHAPWPLSIYEGAEMKVQAQNTLIAFREKVMRYGTVDLSAIAEHKAHEGWGNYFHQMALADKHMCKFVLGRMFDPNPDTRATMEEVMAAANEVSTASKVLSALGGTSASAAFKLAARSSKTYRREVDKLLNGAPLDPPPKA